MANNKCKKCGGSLIDEYGIRRCIHCGTESINPRERHRYLEENKDEIIADFKKIGYKKTVLKWRLSTATIVKLREKWGIVSSRGNDNHLPSLPEFSNDWNPEVQLKWLEIWGNVVAKIGEK